MAHMRVSSISASYLLFLWCSQRCQLQKALGPRRQCCGRYLEVSEGGGQLSHVQSQAPGRASGAVDLLLHILLLRRDPAAAARRQQRQQQHHRQGTSGAESCHHGGGSVR